MYLTQRVKEILSYYESDCPGVKANLARMLMCGKLAGTGCMVILPVDQGFEHGPAKSFALNQRGYDPSYHIELAIEAGLNAYAAPLGMIEAVANSYAGTIPLILKLNSAHSLPMRPELDYDQAVTATVQDALRLGCVAIGLTIYPGSGSSVEMIEELCRLSSEAKRNGLAVVVWSYPRGKCISKKGESAIDIISYSAHIAALVGANIIKVKLPTAHLELPESDSLYGKNGIKTQSLSERVYHIMQAAFAGKRIVLFSGGTSKALEDLYDEATAIKNGGGHGSIIGRNTFQRRRDEALKMLDAIVNIYKS